MFKRLLRHEHAEADRDHEEQLGGLARRGHSIERAELGNDGHEEEEEEHENGKRVFPRDPRRQYVAVQKGRDIPLEGLRKPAPQPNIYKGKHRLRLRATRTCRPQAQPLLVLILHFSPSSSPLSSLAPRPHAQID